MYDRSERITKLRADVPGYELSVKVKEARYLVTSPFFLLYCNGLRYVMPY